MKFRISDEQRALVGTVRDLARAMDFRGNSIKYLDGTYPWENLNALAKIGVLGMSIPEEYGGSHFSVFDTPLVMEEVAKGSYPTPVGLMGMVGVETHANVPYAPESMKRPIQP